MHQGTWILGENYRGSLQCGSGKNHGEVSASQAGVLQDQKSNYKDEPKYPLQPPVQNRHRFFLDHSEPKSQYAQYKPI